MHAISFRPLERRDLPLVSRWLGMPHVVDWWGEAPEIEAVKEKYGPRIEGREPVEVFIVVLDDRDAGLIQRYRLADFPGWDELIRIPDAAAIDYLIGEPDLAGKGVGSAMIRAFVPLIFERYPDIRNVVAAPQQENVASWRAAEKAGFILAWSGMLEDDEGPAHVYVFPREKLT
jgi:aminoglycoside 6'-N-acetyltransferase